MQPLSRCLREYPDQIEEASAHLQRAESLIAIGQGADAVEAFQAALAVERSFPNVLTNAWLEFAWYVAERKLTDHYQEVLASDRAERPFRPRDPHRNLHSVARPPSRGPPLRACPTRVSRTDPPRPTAPDASLLSVVQETLRVRPTGMPWTCDQ